MKMEDMHKYSLLVQKELHIAFFQSDIFSSYERE